MPSHSERQFLPYSPEQLYDMVIDIERYPDFIPWCRAARILERKEGEVLAELVIAFHHLTETYTSRVTSHRPDSIDVVMVKGPFEYLVNRWRFAIAPGGCDADFFLDFKFRSRILEKIMGGMFTKATAKMVDAFRQHADAMFGKKG